jgi:penicillin-binding protein 2
MKDRSHYRLLVVQVLVVSLFATLLARLWYVQVLGGESYQQAAEHNAIRNIELPAARGLIVDAEGRPMVANRTSWVVTVDRDVLGSLDPNVRSAVLGRLARVLGLRVKEVVRRTKLCGEHGAAEPPTCWSGSPYSPVPVAQDVSERLASTILEQPEDYPGVYAESWQVRAYPAPAGINAAHVLGYISPVTSGELAAARERDDTTLTSLSLVGRSGIEDTYDRWLRGVPGDHRVEVNSLGRVIGQAGTTSAQTGDTLVTSIDARVQAVAERQLRSTILQARRTYDPVTHRNYRADSGSVVVLDAKTGQVVALASYPTYDPSEWVGGISKGDLARLYSRGADEPLLSRATQGQLAPGSTFKPFMTAAAFTHGDSPATRLDCSSSFTVGNRVFQNYESEAYGMIDFAKALQVSCDTFFYRVGYANWLKYGSDSGNVHAKDPDVSMAQAFGFGRRTGIDVPGEAAGRIVDRTWKLAYWKANKGYYCKLGRNPARDFIHEFAREFCTDGWRYRAGDAVNFAIGQGDTALTPLQLAVAYGALANGGTLYAPRVVKAIISPTTGRVVKRIKPKVAGRVPVPRKVLHYIDQALLGTARTGTLAWKMGGFPLDKVQIRAKTGSAEVYGKQSTSWLATYDKQYVVVMQVEEAGTGSGTSGPAVRKIWESLYGINGEQVDLRKAEPVDGRPPRHLPRFRTDGSIGRPLNSPYRPFDRGGP